MRKYIKYGIAIFILMIAIAAMNKIFAVSPGNNVNVNQLWETSNLGQDIYCVQQTQRFDTDSGWKNYTVNEVYTIDTENNIYTKTEKNSSGKLETTNCSSTTVMAYAYALSETEILPELAFARSRAQAICADDSRCKYRWYD